MPDRPQLPDGWYDEIVVFGCTRNADGTITVQALVNVYDGQGGCYSEAGRVMRLYPNDKAKANRKAGRSASRITT